MNQEIQRLSQLLTHENKLAIHLLKLMGDEKSILEENSPDKLTSITRLKADCIDQMEDISLQRTRLLLALSSAATTVARMDDVISQQASQEQLSLTTAVNVLETALADCKKQNSINGMIISISQRNVHRNLNIIKGIDHNSMTYTSQGQTTNTGHSNGVVKA